MYETGRCCSWLSEAYGCHPAYVCRCCGVMKPSLMSLTAMVRLSYQTRLETEFARIGSLFMGSPNGRSEHVRSPSRRFDNLPMKSMDTTSSSCLAWPKKRPERKGVPAARYLRAKYAATPVWARIAEQENQCLIGRCISEESFGLPHRKFVGSGPLQRSSLTS